MKNIIKFLLSILLLSTVKLAYANTFNHEIWDSLLHQSVVISNDGFSSKVNYQLFKNKATQLDQYLDQTAKVTKAEFDSWNKNDQLSFLINVYNANTVKLILSKYPNLTSIKDLGSLFSSPWKKEIVNLFGQTISLDDLEHGLIRGSHRYNDPRVHFAVNCASIGCPMLRNEAYIGYKLDGQLEDQAKRFLSDKSRNYLNKDTLNVSSIFKWYRSDFESGWRNAYSLNEFFYLYAKELGIPNKSNNSYNTTQIKIDFLDYNWKLNSFN
ncbi:MAG: DUF547 domain-containing protein [Betaproteobacteria bacterium]|nr:DUF547 domain-containing protein [Betaproteobacteria bacterium]